MPDQIKREATQNNHGQRLQDIETKDISRKDASSRNSTKVLSPRKSLYLFNAQDISIALATFPEFFSQGASADQDILVQPEKQKLTTKDSVTKENLQSECAGLVLWYIREYGL